MHLDINKYFLIFIGWLIPTSYQLECVQCTSPIVRTSQSWDHSCLYGTLTALPCHKPVNGSASSYKQCVSAGYRLGPRGRGGILIHRGCSRSDVVQNECDPVASLINFDGSENFYCSITCSDDGCNRHLFEEITSNANKFFKNKFILLYLIYLILIFNFKYSLFS